MASGDRAEPSIFSDSASLELGEQWRRLTRSATVIAVLTSPVVFLWTYGKLDWPWGWALVATFLAVILFRGLVDIIVRRFIPWPSLFGTDDKTLKEEDIVNRRRAWYWRRKIRQISFVLGFFTLIWLVRVLVPGGSVGWVENITGIFEQAKFYLSQPQILMYAFIFPVFFLFNFLILLGPLMLVGITQMRGFEPGDADWGVRLGDVRGQNEAKEEVSRVVSLWQSGEAFEAAGGKRERGLLFLGPPGTGKTMLAKAIATGFNCFAADVEYMTKDGLKTFGETVGTSQTVLNADGDWVPAEIKSFGTQPLVEIELRPGRHTRSSIRQRIRATRDHRWLTENRGIVTDLQAGDFVPFQAAPKSERDLAAFIRGFGFGDGTLDARGRARIRLCGEKDARLLPLFQEYGHCFVTYPPSFGGDPLVIFNGGHMSDWKEQPAGDEDPSWLASWLEGYLAADGWSTPDGAVVLETQDADAVALVKRIASFAGHMVVGNHTKSNTETNYGPRSAPLVALRLRREGLWRVLSVTETGVEEEVYCAVEPRTQAFTLAGGVLTGNCPFVSMPGSGFAQTFMGMDAVIVRYLAWKAKKLAAKWGGQCIVFIDEIDAVGMRRSALGGGGAVGGMSGTSTGRFEDYAFYGQHGALNPSQDLILETRAWRDRMFEARAPERRPKGLGFMGAIVKQFMPGMMGGGMGQLALNQLLVVMDGIDNPPFFKRLFTNRLNTFLDACYVVPRRLGKLPLRIKPPRPRNLQIYFIGATNVPINVLDPALIRPGRMGRHVWLRTPTKRDRLDIFDLYINKVDHVVELDSEKRRDEIARITNGYAQPLDAKVLTPLGWKRMGDIEVGDEVIGGDGKPTTVMGVHPRGEMDVHRVYLNDGTSTECTADHLWSVDAMDPRMTRRTFTLRELLNRGLRWSSKGSRLYLPKLPAVEYSSTDELPVDPYLLGFMLGDGGLGGTTADVCSDDEESVQRVAELLPAGVALVQHGPRNWWVSGGRRGGKPNPFTESLRKVGVWGHTSHNKFVPRGYKLASADDRLSLLQGLLDTDGTVDYRRGTGTEFYTCSKQLAADVADVVRSLGGLARVKPKREGWRVAIDLGGEHKPFRLTRKANVHRAARKPFRRRISSVEPVGLREVQCITVANEDGLYVTDDFIVTHNSPAMIEQVCSMALTYAHSDGRERFSWEDIVEAMTTIESGMAIKIEYVPEETRAVAIHEAGHAVAGHVYMKGAESTRLSIRRRGDALGHHQALEKEERFSSWRSEEVARLIWTLGAMAAERVFYGENSTGVGGDVQSATARAAWMVGACAMAPERIEVNGRFKKEEDADRERKKIARRFETIGTQIMNRAGGGGPMEHDPHAGVMMDRDKRSMACQLIGQAYVAAHLLIEHNREAVEKIADVLVDRKELHGDEIVGLLDNSELTLPEVDLTDEAIWPKL